MENPDVHSFRKCFFQAELRFLNSWSYYALDDIKLLKIHHSPCSSLPIVIGIC